ncbi:MAG TPA: hypothetical protein VIK59_11555, partial [Verrucomicrobiae bacterium]
MKKLWLVSAGAAFILGITLILNAQTSDLQTELEALEMTSPTAGADAPEFGTFYSFENPQAAPAPADVLGLDFWSLGSGFYVLDDRQTSDNEAMSQTTRLKSSFGGMSLTDDLSGEVLAPALNLDTNRLYLQITNVSNGQVYLNLMNATDMVYEIFSKTDLSATNWDIESELFPTDTISMPFNVPQLNRTNLFLWARDWTGVTSEGNT